MKEITLHVNDSHYTMLLQYLKSLTYVDVKIPRAKSKSEVEPQPPSEHENLVNFILSYQNDNPSFGDAAEWQQRERADRDLPLQL